MEPLPVRMDVPAITLQVPLQAIDQIYPGMRGQLTLTGLPMRSAPDLEVTLSAVSQEAEKGEDGLPLYFVARAELSREDLEVARAEMGEQLRLSPDMPVSVALEGRHITFFEFLFTPITSMFQDAFQDA